MHELSNQLGIIKFRNQTSVRKINVFQWNFLVPRLLDKGENIITNVIPSILVETRRKAIQSRGLPSRHVKKRLLDLRVLDLRL